MSLVTVRDTPQAVFLNGMQEQVAITNNGPFTVLIDDVSSIGETSYPLPPMATIAWDSGRDLWLMAKPVPESIRPSTASVSAAQMGYVNSTVYITGNDDAMLADRAGSNVKLLDYSRTVSQSLAYPVETEAFDTLIIDYETVMQADYLATGNTPPITDSMFTLIEWYSPGGVITASERFNHPLQDSNFPIYGQRLITQIKDSYAQITMSADQSSSAFPLKFRVYALNRKLPESFHYWIRAGSPPMNVWNVGLTGVNEIHQTSDTAQAFELSNSATPVLAPDLWIAPIKPKLFLNLRANNVTVAASLIVETVVPWINTLRTVTIPVTAGANIETQIDNIPVGTPLRIRMTAATGVTRLLMVWQD